ncbi:BA14K family protein [Rhizobium mayense]|uniref:BA14K family protein n=1 Tax=Rhizobium mayense TaxID=1312184 RepID=A0ABT7K4S6_9HYPH|nr:BA14K family protein [Rhizobium mayense]MDL2403620.1 BA14K family protein [Rhizobium mayense]
MAKFVSQIASTTMAAAVAACASMSAQAMPMPAVHEIAAAKAPGNVQEVYWHGGWGGGWHGGWGGGWHGGWGGWHGYYGGYHYHNDYWYPLAAFGAGALIGGLAAQPYYYSQPYYYPPSYYYPRASHYAWCQGRYHLYRCRLAY